MSRPRKSQHEPHLYEEGMITKKALAEALREIREYSNLRQIDLARHAGWNRSVISRLESDNGRLPDLHTLATHARTCGLDVGLVFASPDANRLRVHSALTLQATSNNRPYEMLFGLEIARGAPDDCPEPGDDTA